MNKISKRLELIASFIPDNSKVIDIGCDHGLLDIYLYQNKKNISIIASDINEQALNNAKKNISDNRLIIQKIANGITIIYKSIYFINILLINLFTPLHFLLLINFVFKRFRTVLFCFHSEQKRTVPRIVILFLLFLSINL